ncbi:MAG: phosphotransferase family protein [Candidatus Hydrogenedentota bacterium]|nr:MAG: phosphotransferase family protein [Candidatus Hydrogenedentota bacterium]
MSDLIDHTAGVRKGEELDLAVLEPYIRRELDLPDGAFEVEQFPGGHSNLTYLIRIGGREMVLRRPPFGSTVKSAHDMGREHTILSKLHPVYSPAPKPLLFCQDHDIMGCDFYAMERIRGMILRKDKPEGFEATEDEVRRACEAIAINLADLHAIDWKSIGLDVLQKKEGTFVRRQVEGWIRRYDASKTDDLPIVNQVFEWCQERIPEDTDAVLIHNDYKFDNLILDSSDISNVIGVLDWEMSTIGDPIFDLGVTLGYWTDPDEPEGVTTSSCFLTRMPGAISRKEFARIYGERSGRDVSNLHYYYVFALIKLAVVLQQIYYRYHQGLTKDERFAALQFAVPMLAERANMVIEQGDI